jgi:hypothetical protein
VLRSKGQRRGVGRRGDHGINRRQAIMKERELHLLDYEKKFIAVIAYGNGFSVFYGERSPFFVIMTKVTNSRNQTFSNTCTVSMLLIAQ